MSKRTLFLAAYDVSSPARLRQALHAVKEYASGGQKSVYECWLSEAERRELMAALRDILEPAEDRFMLLRLDPRSRVRTLGVAVKPADPDYFYVG